MTTEARLARTVVLAVLLSLPAGTTVARDRPPSLVITRPAPASLPRQATPARRSQEPGRKVAQPSPTGHGVADATGVASLRVDDRLVHYPVYGNDLETLRKAFASQSRSDLTGGSHGRTVSRIGIQYAPRPVPGGCVAQDPAVEMTVTTTLPEWTPKGLVDKALRARWIEVAEALQRHEARHRGHALDAARELRETLASLGVKPDCHALRREIDHAFLRVTLRAEFRDDRYDARTRNGIEEGISL